MLHDYAGRTDPHGNPLAVTAPAVADELAAAADLVKRKLDRRPAAVVRGMSGLVLSPAGTVPAPSPWCATEAEDMFGLGAREAVLSALHADDPRGFGSPCCRRRARRPALGARRRPRPEVRHEDGAVVARLGGTEREQGAAEAMLRTAAFALGWRPAGRPPTRRPARRDSRCSGSVR